MAKTLVIYYSRRGQNYVNGSIKSLKKGNTEIVAECIKEAVNADLFEVETVREYAEDYRECTNEAAEEKRNHARPELKRYPDDVSEYDNIVVAGPCWWGTYPMAVFSALDRLDLKDKKLFPVMTHEGSGLGSCAGDLKQYSSHIGSGLAVHGADAETSRKAVTAWVNNNLK